MDCTMTGPLYPKFIAKEYVVRQAGSRLNKQVFFNFSSSTKQICGNGDSSKTVLCAVCPKFLAVKLKET